MLTVPAHCHLSLLNHLFVSRHLEAEVSEQGHHGYLMSYRDSEGVMEQKSILYLIPTHVMSQN